MAALKEPTLRTAEAVQYGSSCPRSSSSAAKSCRIAPSESPVIIEAQPRASRDTARRKGSSISGSNGARTWLAAISAERSPSRLAAATAVDNSSARA
jgi:hypothetical protein